MWEIERECVAWCLYVYDDLYESLYVRSWINSLNLGRPSPTLDMYVFIGSCI